MANRAIPFTAAIFDLDGTLLDSLWVWQRVDDVFFAARGLDKPSDYARAIQGLSFREAAVYTVRRFDLPESVDAVMDEWMRNTVAAYANEVQLKPGALRYLRALKRGGVRLAVATANRRELFIPALRRCGALQLFDAVVTCAEAGDGDKTDGAVFLLAAERLDVAPGDCAVFEDTLEGILGAKRAGMRAFAVRDGGNDHHSAEIAARADGVIDDFTAMERLHPLPGPGRCVIFTARCEGDPSAAYAPRAGDCVLCADGGWRLARAAGAAPALVIGDFDSSEEPGDLDTLRVPAEKDDTDTMLCLKRGLSMGYDDFLIVGGFGGRADHTLANLQSLCFAAQNHARAVMFDGLTWAAAVHNGTLRVPADALGGGVPSKLSAFAMGENCRGVCIRGAKYPLEDGELSSAFPLGVSNEFAAPCAEISVGEGTLVAMVCRADQETGACSSNQ